MAETKHGQYAGCATQAQGGSSAMSSTAIKPEDLQAQLQALQKQVDELAYAKDYLEIWQVMSMYSHLYHVFKRAEIIDLFATETPGVMVEVEDSGIYDGMAGVKRFFGGILGEAGIWFRAFWAST